MDQVIAELDRLDRWLRDHRHPRRRLLLAKERKYFRNQRERMDYAAQICTLGASTPAEADC